MKSFGKLLKEERELRGITLDEVADHTKVNLRYLKAIEEDDLKSLPAGTFIRGFLKSYAKFIGLNPEEVVFNFDQFVSTLTKDEQSSFVQTTSPSKKGSRFFFIPVVILIPLLVILGYSFHVPGKGYPLFSFNRIEQSAVNIGSTKNSEDKQFANKTGFDVSKNQVDGNTPASDSMLHHFSTTIPYQIPVPYENEASLKKDAFLVKPHNQETSSMDGFQMSLSSYPKDHKLESNSFQTAQTAYVKSNDTSTQTSIEETDKEEPVEEASPLANEKNASSEPLEKPPDKEIKEPIPGKPSDSEIKGQGSEKIISGEPKEHVLEVTWTEKAWIRVYVDNERVFEGTLEPPVTKVWHAKEKFMLSTGNAGGLELKLDNQKLPPVGKKGEVVTGVTFPKVSSRVGAGRNKITSNNSIEQN
jgi:cytoskeletal protein RodZ